MIPPYVASLVSVCYHCFSKVPFFDWKILETGFPPSFSCPKALQPRSKEPSAWRQIHTLRTMPLYHVTMWCMMMHDDACYVPPGHTMMLWNQSICSRGKAMTATSWRVTSSKMQICQKKHSEPAEEGRQSNSPEMQISTYEHITFPFVSSKAKQGMRTSFVGVAAQNLGLTKRCSIKNSATNCIKCVPGHRCSVTRGFWLWLLEVSGGNEAGCKEWKSPRPQLPPQAWSHKPWLIFFWSHWFSYVLFVVVVIIIIIIIVLQSFFIIVAIFFNSFSPMHTLWLPANTSFSQPEKRMEAQDCKDVNPLPQSYGQIARSIDFRWIDEFETEPGSKFRPTRHLPETRRWPFWFSCWEWLPHLCRAMEYILCHLKKSQGKSIINYQLNFQIHQIVILPELWSYDDINTATQLRKVWPTQILTQHVGSYSEPLFNSIKCSTLLKWNTWMLKI